MARGMPMVLLLCLCTGDLRAQDLAGLEVHGFVTQGFLYSSHNNYLTMPSSNGSPRWTDAAVSVVDSVSPDLRVGIQFHLYQLGDLGGQNIQIDWASGDYKLNDHFGVRAGKVKTALGLFNDAQDVDAIFLWTLLPQCSYPIDNKGFFLSHLGGEVYGDLPLGRAGGVQYRGHAGETNLDANGGYLKQIADAGLVFPTAPSGKTYGGDLRWDTPLQGLSIGSSGDVQALDGRASGGTLHAVPALINVYCAQFKRGKLYFAGEYDRTPVAVTVTIEGTPISLPVDGRSWFAMGSYRVSEKIQLGSYYSHFVNKAMDTRLSQNYSKDWVVSARYDFDAYFYAKLEGHFLRGTALGYYASSNPQGLDPNSNMLAAKVGFSF